MKTPATLICYLLISGTAVFAQDTKPAALSSAGWNEKTDYTAIRLNYASAPGYNAYALQVLEKALIAEAMQEWKTGKMADALIKLQKVTTVHPLSIEAYRRLADGYAVFIRAAKDPEQKRELEPIEHHYRVISDGLLKSITASGDGRTPETAFKVISIPEEYMTLWYLGLSPQGQTLEEYDGLPFDVLKVKNRKTGEQSSVFFDIRVFCKEANQPVETTAPAVTPPAKQEARQP
jgi:hypothetical protein